MKKLWLLSTLFISLTTVAQELYVFSEPASNMPAKSVGIRQQFRNVEKVNQFNGGTRSSTEVMYGINRNWMFHAAFTLSDMYSPYTRFESFRVYGKYRFFSQDDIYRHLRMAVFGEISFSRNPLMYDEISLEGDLSGAQTGLIITQLLHKLAISATGSYVNSLLPIQNDMHSRPISQDAFSYSISAGYLLFPMRYTNYNQTNVNLYCELLGQKALLNNLQYTDLAPAIQFIFNSQTKLNLGYRYQLSNSMHRMGRQGWLLSMEWLFLKKPKVPL